MGTLRETIITRQADRPRAKEAPRVLPTCSVEEVTDYVLNRENLTPEQIKRIETEASTDKSLARQIENLTRNRPFLIGRHTCLFEV